MRTLQPDQWEHDDLAGICLDCWEELHEESVYMLSRACCPISRLRPEASQAEAEGQDEDDPDCRLGPFSLEALKQLRFFILQNYDYQDMASEVELVQTRAHAWWSWAEAVGAALLRAGGVGRGLRSSTDRERPCNSHLHVAGAGKLFGNVFTGFVTANFRLDASNRRGTNGHLVDVQRDRWLDLGARLRLAAREDAASQGRLPAPPRTPGPPHKPEPHEVERRHSGCIGCGGHKHVSPFPMLATAFLRRAFLEAGIQAAAPAAAAAARDAG